MAPITLFFGANSSGKSSIGQFLMMLKQTVASPDRKAVFNPGERNSAVQLGSYQDMVYQRNIENKISFEYEWKLNRPAVFTGIMSKKMYTASRIRFYAQVAMEHGSDGMLCVESLNYHLISQSEPNVEIGMKREKNTEYQVDTKGFSLKRNKGIVRNPVIPVRFYGFPNEVIAYYRNTEFVQGLNLLHERLFTSIFYLGPIRVKPERLYAWAGDNSESVGYTGEYAIASMLAYRKRKIGIGFKKAEKPFEQIIASSLKSMGLIEDFKVRKISEQRHEYEVKLMTKGSHEWVDLPDVGFGISQVLPVLVQCYYAPPGSIIIMEQPEIHLHPSAQSALADVMIDVINSRENKADRNIQLIIETHSEHFLRRLQRRIAEGVIAQEKVSAYFANISETPAKLEPLEIDLFGNILNWPENFFGDEMEDIIAQTKAALDRSDNRPSPKHED
jgi:predicted ATPase